MIDDIVHRKMQRALDDRALRSVFLDARTGSGFLERAVPHELLERAVELALHGPTGSNGLPMRLVFVESLEGKERLRPALSSGNVEKTMGAPVTAIVATDLSFFEQYSRTNPPRAESFKASFGGMEPAARRTHAWDNAVLQMAYLIVALRAVGLDAGPMGGFQRPLVDAEFFADGRFVSQYLINIGYADDEKLRPRLPRLTFEEIARFV